MIGAHHMIDVIGGIALAAASIWTAKLYLSWLGHASLAVATAGTSPAWQPHLGMEPQ